MGKRFIFVGAIALWSSLTVWAQSRPHEKASPAQQQHAAGNKFLGSISGRIFLITEAGDLKPARFANVYLLSGTPNKNDESAVMVFLKKQIEEAESRTATLTKKREEMESSGAGVNDSEESGCLEELLMETHSVQAAADWADESKQYSQFVGTQADEDGVFRLSGIALNSGTGESLRKLNPKTSLDGFAWNYTIVVRGRAGANEAYWEKDLQFLQVNGAMSWRVGSEEFKKGRDVTIKLGSPEKACLVLSP
jgi:hypothetical protein